MQTVNILYKEPRRRAAWLFVLIRAPLASCGHDFQPRAIRILNKIDTHSGILIADTAHLFMEPVSRFKVIGTKGQMEFTFSQVVFGRVFF